MNISVDKIKKMNIFDRFKRLSWKKKGLLLLGVIVVVWLLVTQLFSQKSTTSQYQTATAQQGSIIASVSESGNVSAGSQTDVASPTTGIIEAIYVKNGDTVTEGENLFKVKSTATPQQKASAFATYESSLSSYQGALQAKQAAQATLETDRQAIIDAQNAVNNTPSSDNQLQKDSLNSKLTSARETFTADETKYNNEETAIVAANAQLNADSLSYQATQDSTVTAPVGGVVANLAVQKNNSVTAASGTSSSTSSSGTSSSGSSTSTSSPVLVIGNFSQLSVVAQVNEVDIPKVKAGQNATITLDAFPNETFAGQVTSVDSVGTTSSGVVTYNVYIDLIAPPSTIKPGMTASVTIQTARHDNVITVPTAAIQTTNGVSSVRILKNGQITQVPVTTGIVSDTDTEITSGVNEGDVVVIGTGTTGSATSSPFSGGFGGGGRNRGGGSVFFRGAGG